MHAVLTQESSPQPARNTHFFPTSTRNPILSTTSTPNPYMLEFQPPPPKTHTSDLHHLIFNHPSLQHHLISYTSNNLHPKLPLVQHHLISHTLNNLHPKLPLPYPSNLVLLACNPARLHAHQPPWVVGLLILYIFTGEIHLTHLSFHQYSNFFKTCIHFIPII